MQKAESKIDSANIFFSDTLHYQENVDTGSTSEEYISEWHYDRDTLVLYKTIYKNVQKAGKKEVQVIASKKYNEVKKIELKSGLKKISETKVFPWYAILIIVVVLAVLVYFLIKTTTNGKQWWAKIFNRS